MESLWDSIRPLVVIVGIGYWIYEGLNSLKKNKNNKTQKIFLMIGLSSFFFFIISMTILEWDMSFSTRSSGIRGNTSFPFIPSKTNWFGIISLFTMFVSLVGYFIFGDEKDID
jgi:hypothetical protein